jgi:hypothetical protein
VREEIETSDMLAMDATHSWSVSEAVRPIRVATGEHVHNGIMFKQFLQAGAIDVCQIDACRRESWAVAADRLDPQNQDAMRGGMDGQSVREACRLACRNREPADAAALTTIATPTA